MSKLQNPSRKIDHFCNRIFPIIHMNGKEEGNLGSLRWEACRSSRSSQLLGLRNTRRREPTIARAAGHNANTRYSFIYGCVDWNAPRRRDWRRTMLASAQRAFTANWAMDGKENPHLRVSYPANLTCKLHRLLFTEFCTFYVRSVSGHRRITRLNVSVKG